MRSNLRAPSRVVRCSVVRYMLEILVSNSGQSVECGPRIGSAIVRQRIFKEGSFVIIRRVLGLLVLGSIAVALSTDAALADRLGFFKSKDDTKVRYTVVTPFPFVKTKAYPAIIAFPGGRQDTAAAKAAIADFWGEEARKRGFYVFVPEAPKGFMFYQRGAFLAPELIEHFKKKFKIDCEKFHLAGHSNGGISAFRIALKNRKRIQSLTVFLGFPAFTRDFQRLTRLKKIKVNIFVNENDERWRSMTDFTHERLKRLGIDVSYKKFTDKGHKVVGLAGPNSKMLFDTIAR